MGEAPGPEPDQAGERAARLIRLLGWTALLLGLWAAGVPLEVGASYGYAAPG